MPDRANDRDDELSTVSVDEISPGCIALGLHRPSFDAATLIVGVIFPWSDLVELTLLANGHVCTWCGHPGAVRIVRPGR